MRPYTLQKPLDIKNLEEGLREYFRQLSWSARQDAPAYAVPGSPDVSRNRVLEMT
jgi:hypothetical protein